MAGALTAAIAAAFSGGAAVVTDEYFEYTTLLLPGNGTNGAQNNTFLDGSTNNFTITRNGHTTQGTFSPFSQTGWGGYFDGSNDYVSVADNAVFDLSNQNFTVEGWFNPSALPSSGGLYYLAAQLDDSLAATSQAWQLSIFNSSGTYTLQADLISGSTGYAVNGTFAFAVGTWYHVAFIRTTGGVTRLFVNGNQVGSDGSANVTVNNSPTAVTIGCRLVSGSPQSGRVFNGYVSNFRLTVGAALYTSAFTPSTVPLTTTSQGASASQVELLTLQNNRFVDNSSNGFTVTPNNGAAITPFSPFNPTASWSAATYGGSGYFDGSGDYLSAPTNAAFNLGTADFTIEWSFYYSEAPPASSGYDYLFGMGASATTGIALYIQGGVPKVWNGSLVLTSSQSVVGFTWYHLALVRSSGTLTMYLNGTSVGSVSFTSNLTGGELSSGPSIGTWSPVDLSYFPGYISNFRIVKGTAIVPPAGGPASPLTAVSGTSLLLNFTNAGIYDATSKNDLETVGNAQISTAISAQWGSGSMAFDGTGDWLKARLDDPLVYFGSGDWTVEGWVYLNNTTGTQSFIVGQSNFSTAANASYSFYVTGSSAGDVFIGSTNYALGAAGLSATTWTHCAWVRSGSTMTFYRGGTSITSVSVGTGSINNGTTNPLTIGAANNGTSPLNGYIQDLRITKGYARYTTNFTPPTAAFPTL